ncbi:MAG TPA: hypothetical protein VHT25_13745 [Solirubrobacteraceae bacterium]|jgi:hypothetical protein|nr:hypothetical protein [Solirubrobacteraceae bacterium]
MKRIKLLGLASVALIVMAVSASSAFGFSEFNAAGKANPAGITTKGAGGKAFFESVGGNKVECEKSASTGKFVSHTEAVVEKLEYSGNCKLSGTISAKCPTISIKELKVTPGTNAGKPVDWFQPKVGTTMAEFTCESTKVKVIGSVICLNKKPTLGLKGEVECKQTAKGKQEFKEGEFLGKTETGKFLEAEATLGFFKLKEEDAQNTTEVITSSAEVEQTP